MKKLVAFLMILSITISSSISFCFANEEVVVSEETRDFWEDVIDTLDENEYGGAYIKDGVLHIKPQDKIEVQNIVSETAPNTRAISSVILDDEAKYTLNELKDAMSKTTKLWETFDLNYVALSEEYNGLLIGSYEWTEQKQKEFVDAVGIENIIFETVNRYDEEYSTEEMNKDKNLEKVKKQELPGTLIYNDNVRDDKTGDRLRSTLTACVVGEMEGYITTAHKGVEKGHKILYDKDGNAINDKETLGYVKDRIEDGSRGIDAAFIKQDIYAPSSNVLPNGAGNSAYLMTEEKAVEGDKVKIFGGQNRNPVEAVIKSTYCTKEWETPDDNGDYTWYNMIMMYINSPQYTQEGDSGAPVTVKIDNKLDYYGIVGVYKGADIYTGSSS